MFFEAGHIMEDTLLDTIMNLAITYNSKIVSCDFIELPEYTFYYQDSLYFRHDLETKKIYTNKDYFNNLNTLNIHEIKKICTIWNKLFHKSVFNDFSFLENLYHIDYKSIKSLYSKSNLIIETNTVLIGKFLIDEHYKSICFDYTELEYIDFMQEIFLDFKKLKNKTGIKNTCINILKLLYYLRTKLSYCYLDIYDKEEQQKNLDKKFTSIKIFLTKNYSQHKNEYEEFIEKYLQLLKNEKFRKKYPVLFSYPI